MTKDFLFEFTEALKTENKQFIIAVLDLSGDNCHVTFDVQDLATFDDVMEILSNIRRNDGQFEK